MDLCKLLDDANSVTVIAVFSNEVADWEIESLVAEALGIEVTDVTLIKRVSAPEIVGNLLLNEGDIFSGL